MLSGSRARVQETAITWHGSFKHATGSIYVCFFSQRVQVNDVFFYRTKIEYLRSLSSYDISFTSSFITLNIVCTQSKFYYPQINSSDFLVPIPPSALNASGLVF